MLRGIEEERISMNLFDENNSIVEMKWDKNFAYVLNDENIFMPTEFNMFKKMRNSCFVKWK